MPTKVYLCDYLMFWLWGILTRFVRLMWVQGINMDKDDHKEAVLQFDTVLVQTENELNKATKGTKLEGEQAAVLIIGNIVFISSLFYTRSSCSACSLIIQPFYTSPTRWWSSPHDKACICRVVYTILCLPSRYSALLYHACINTTAILLPMEITQIALVYTNGKSYQTSEDCYTVYTCYYLYCFFLNHLFMQLSSFCRLLAILLPFWLSEFHGLEESSSIQDMQHIMVNPQHVQPHGCLILWLQLMPDSYQIF